MPRGGGAALIRVLKGIKDLEGANEDQAVGIRLLARSLEEPLRQIVENAGEDAAVVLNAVRAGRTSFRACPRRLTIERARVPASGACSRGCGHPPSHP
ncbi:MAG: hypothetical protein ABI645_13305 [Pseudomonadota bacterium]